MPREENGHRVFFFAVGVGEFFFCVNCSEYVRCAVHPGDPDRFVELAYDYECDGDDADMTADEALEAFETVVSVREEPQSIFETVRMGDNDLPEESEE